MIGRMSNNNQKNMNPPFFVTSNFNFGIFKTNGSSMTGYSLTHAEQVRCRRPGLMTSSADK